MKAKATIDDRRRITLPKDLGFLPGQSFALERTAEGVLLRPLKPEPSKAKPSGGKHLRRKGGILVWTGSVPDVDPVTAVQMGRDDRERLPPGFREIFRR
jgi:bifunctional DNA-binding transcriptional regulator/antitoxin component of YhaV-PrlF toxin-antitoxin module